MTRQSKATQFSLLVHAMFVLAAIAISQHTPPVQLPMALDFSIMPTAGPPASGPPPATMAAQPAPAPAAPVEQATPLKPVAKKAPPAVVKKKVMAEKKPPLETVPIAASPQGAQPQEATPTAATTEPASIAPQGAGQSNNRGSGSGGIYAAGQLDGPLAAIAKSPPVYPPGAKRRNIEGWIKVKFVVDEQGQVDKVSVLEAEPEGIFEQAVVRCITGWRFRPGTKGGVAVKALVEQTITFKLEG